MRANFAAAVAATALLVSPCAATDYAKFGEVEGGVIDPGREGWSELKAYKGGIKRNEDGTVEAKETKITICADRSGAALALKLATGEVIPEVKLEFEKPNNEGAAEVYLRITLCNVTITEIETEKAKGDGELVEETYCVKFEQIKISNPVDGTEAVIDVSGGGTGGGGGN